MEKKMRKPFEPYSPDERRRALDELLSSAKGGKPAFCSVARRTGISVSTLKRWWINHQLERQRELRAQFEGAIAAILHRMQKLAQQTNNLKELAPVVKMLSELLQRFEGESEGEEIWG